nr:autotransporter outer membrane beta-barrel domain-containing protein [Ochrobactrum sp. 3-3]
MGSGVTGTVTLDSSNYLVFDTHVTNTNGTGIIIGGSGTGILNIENGSTVYIHRPVILGQEAGGSGTLNISGENSILEKTNRLQIGLSGVGALNITDGGKLDTTFQFSSGNLTVGENAGSSGSVLVSGFGSTLTAGGQSILWLDIGESGAGSLTIENGGVADFQAIEVNIGTDATGSGVVTVTGQNSAWTIDRGNGSFGDVVVGSHGTGTLTISDQGAVNVGTVRIADWSGSAGTVNIGAAASDAAAAAGTLTTDSIIFGAGAGVLTFNYTDAGYVLEANISGAGTINQMTGITTLTGDGSGFSGTTNVTGGELHIGDGNTTGSLNGTIVDDTKVVFNRSDDLTFTGSLSSDGAVQKLGAGMLTMTGDSSAFDGSTSVDAGTLWVNGTLGGTVDVVSGAKLGGTNGTIGGNTTVASGGTLIGSQGNVLTFNGDLSLASGSNIDVALGQAPNASGLFDVHGNLTLNGTLNITDQGDFGPGLYRLFDYGGTLSGGLTLGNVPSGSDRNAMEFDKSNAGQYNLNYTGIVANNIWAGGDGTWNATNTNWTDINGSQTGVWNQGDYAQFGGTKGHQVTVDDSADDLTAQGLVFSTDGYVLSGDYIILEGSKDPTIRVGDGSAAGAGMTATIASELRGNQGMSKIDYGTLVLTGTNTYTGGTTVNQGTLQLGAGGNSGSILGDVVVNRDQYGYGTLAFDRSDIYNFTGVISGDGNVVQRGAGTTVFAGDNTFSGGLTVEKGTARAGIADHAFGSGLLTVGADGTADLAGFNETAGGLSGSGHVALGSGTLTLDQDVDTTFSGAMDGTGGLTKNGSGKLTLSGIGSYVGDTNVNAGALEQGAAGAFSGASAYSVAQNALIELGGYDTTVAALSHSGTVDFGGNGGTTLNVVGNYAGNGGTLVINSVLNGDGSKTDMLKVGGDTSGNTNLRVINRGGLGDQTVNGIEVVDVGGQSNGTFSLMGDFVTRDGKQAVSGGAYAYTLQQGSGTGNQDGNWYLTSQLDGPGPDPRYSPSVPVYEGYLQNMRALNKLPTLQERVGERYWTGKNGDGQTNGAAVDDRGVWARVEGAHNRLEPDTSLTRMKQDINTFIMQAGVDGQFYEGETGKLIAGITGQYGHAKGDISSFHGDGAISTDGWSLGATATWYGNSGFYVDGQAQVTWFDSDLNSWTADQGLADGRKATGYALSVEAGQRIAIDQNWSLTPQAQLSYSSINANGFNDVWDSHVSLHDGDSLIGRIGIAANYANAWKGEDGLMINTTVYGIANLYQEMLGGSSVNVAGVDFDTDNDRTWGGIGAGGTYAWADNKYAVYGEGSINTALNHFADSYSLKGTVGFKVKW